MARRRMTLKRIDPWSVLKFGFILNLCLLGIGMLGFGVVWFVVQRLELIDKVCSLALEVGFSKCGINGGNLFRMLFLLGLLGVVVQTGLMVFLTFLHNLIADLVGGITLTLEEEGGPRGATMTSRGVALAAGQVPATPVAAREAVPHQPTPVATPAPAPVGVGAGASAGSELERMARAFEAEERARTSRSSRPTEAPVSRADPRPAERAAPAPVERAAPARPKQSPEPRPAVTPEPVPRVAPASRPATPAPAGEPDELFGARPRPRPQADPTRPWEASGAGGRNDDR